MPPVRELPELPQDPVREARIEARRRELEEQAKILLMNEGERAMNEIEKVLDELRMAEQRSLERIAECRSFRRYMLQRPDLVKYSLAALNRYVPISPDEDRIRVQLGISMEKWEQFAPKE